MTCKPGCNRCCGLVPWSPEEWAKVKDRAPAGIKIANLEGAIIPVPAIGTTCLFWDNGCTVYEDRPFMCRLFGTAPTAMLRCPEGCRPTHQIAAAKAAKLTRKYRETMDA
jgi:hypothetical protein